MSESSDDNFSDSSDAGSELDEEKVPEKPLKKQVAQSKKGKKNKKGDDSDWGSSDDEDEPKKKRKTLKEYIAEREERERLEALEQSEPEENPVAFPVINPLNFIKNKELRHKKFRRNEGSKKKEEKQARKKRKLEPGPKSKGHTIESLRVEDQTAVADMNDSDNEETRKELELDEYSEYFSKIYEPKVLITYSDNPCSKTRGFGKELMAIIPNSIALTRHRSSVKKICASAIREGYTDVLIINENRKKVNGLLVIHLPGGPTAHFKVCLFNF